MSHTKSTLKLSEDLYENSSSFPAMTSSPYLLFLNGYLFIFICGSVWGDVPISVCISMPIEVLGFFGARVIGILQHLARQVDAVG